ncbi:hypothetical protein [Rudaea sp.]|uniref:tetratricopeptide repeat protein n=1 Tax=Rudaea sp. TaxID=2136325 RepID=UPI002ED2095B
MQTAATPVVPFWNRLRTISLYAFRGESLITLIVLSACSLLSLLPGVGVIIRLLVTVAFYKFGFEVLHATADGRMDPPAGGLRVEESSGWSAIWLQTGFIALAVLALLLFGPVFGLIAVIVLAFGWPGAMMSLAIDGSVSHALNPVTWLSIMSRLGWPYFVATLLCLVIYVSMANAQALFAPFLPSVLAIFLAQFLSGYALVTTCHLMGYLVHQYQDELGYVSDQPASAPTPPRDPDRDVLDQTEALIRDGKAEEAAKLLHAQLRSRGGADTAHLRYRKLLRLIGDRDGQLQHGREYLSSLVARDKEILAVDIARECAELDPAFAPTRAEETTWVAHKAAQLGQSQTALRLLSGFHRRHPDSADIPKNYLLAATLMFERFNRDKDAHALLTQLQKSYPGHELQPRIAQQLAIVERMLNQAPAKPA